ncbi:MAG: 4Fe-4S cluster-binding domain-containing protein [Oscillospiraceae bacterium]|nr:4Fe-4S cluster-binding domain-containing protein [Oscillospiraceae bacterium]
MLSYAHCTLCPRRCGVDRTRGQLGFCKMPGQVHAARAGVHYWEEPVISGSFGSGAVFFSGCTLKCAFCQNYDISQENFGKPLTSAELRAAFERLIDEGVQNVNLVTPTHFLPDILPALEPKLPVPVVYNCGGYESVETLWQLEGKIDVYLPDFKYSDNALAKKLSSAPDYFETASAAILEMYRQVGKPVIEGDEMKRGVLVRHLVLPGCVDNSLGVLDWVAEHFRSGDILFSLMSQYVPMGRAAEMPPFDRRITELEYDSVLSYMMLLGIEDGYTQDFSSAERGYTPSFDLTGL